MNGRRRRHWRKYKLPYRIILTPSEDANASMIEMAVEIPEEVHEEPTLEPEGVEGAEPEDGEPADEETEPTEELSELDDETEETGDSA